MAITQQHFDFITKVVHFVAQSLLFATLAITDFDKNARKGMLKLII